MSFPSQDGEKTVTCRITADALREKFHTGASGPELLDGFDRNRPRIESAASRRYDRGDPGGTVAVILTVEDF